MERRRREKRREGRVAAADVDMDENGGDRDSED